MVRSPKITKKIIRTNQVIICKQCITDNDGVSGVINEDKKITWKIYHKNLSIVL